MRPAVTTAPREFLLAFVICALVIATSFLVKPATTMYVVLGVGIAMALAVAVAAVKQYVPDPLAVTGGKMEWGVDKG